MHTPTGNEAGSQLSPSKIDHVHRLNRHALIETRPDGSRHANARVTSSQGCIYFLLRDMLDPETCGTHVGLSPETAL